MTSASAFGPTSSLAREKQQLLVDHVAQQVRSRAFGNPQRGSALFLLILPRRHVLLAAAPEIAAAVDDSGR